MSLMVFVPLLHALAIACGSLDGFVGLYISFNPVYDVALYVFAHIIMLISNGSIPDRSRRPGPSALIILHLLDHIIPILRVPHAPP